MLLLQTEEEQFARELQDKLERVECGYCEEKERKQQEYLKQIEIEKADECRRALQRDKIAKGMLSTKDEAVRLREFQKLQVLEKQLIQKKEDDYDRWWHTQMLNHLQAGEQRNRVEADKRLEEMRSRRKDYDQQIRSAERERNAAIREERDKENKRLDRMQEKMKHDYYEALRRKKEIEKNNKTNYIEGHELKIQKTREEKSKERELDMKAIQHALLQLRQEKDRKAVIVKKLQRDRDLMLANNSIKKKVDRAMELELENTVEAVQQENDKKNEEFIKEALQKQFREKQKATEEYRKYLQAKQERKEMEKREREATKQRVQNSAQRELRMKLHTADEELREQALYRRQLDRQRNDRHRIFESETKSIVEKQAPFTRRPKYFRDAVEKIDQCGEEVSWPMHPFARAMMRQPVRKMQTTTLPFIQHSH